MDAKRPNERPTTFFARNPVFRHEEFLAAHAGDGSRSEHTTSNVLAQHVKTGRLLRVRRGLYAVVNREEERGRAVVDPYLLAAKLAPDSVVAYHSALEFHGKAYSVRSRVTYLARTRGRSFRFQGTDFVPVQFPAPLQDLPDAGGGVIEVDRAGGTVRVTSLERTLVDVLDMPKHGGGLEEIWRSLESIEYVDIDAVTEYALMLGTSLTVARVGFYLDQHRDQLMLDEKHLAPLRRHAPSRPLYIERRREPGKLVAGWNLIVPERVLSRSWEEFAG